TVSIQDAGEQQSVLRVKQGSRIRHLEYDLWRIEKCASFPGNVVACRIKKPRWFCRVIAQGRRPTLRYCMRTTQQTAVCTDACETTRGCEIDDGQLRHESHIAKLPLLERSAGNQADSRVLAECF